MNLKEFMEPELCLINFRTQDIITTSDGGLDLGGDGYPNYD